MTTKEILTVLQGEIHTTVFATVDDDGLPQTCVIDLIVDAFTQARGCYLSQSIIAKAL